MRSYFMPPTRPPWEPNNWDPVALYGERKLDNIGSGNGLLPDDTNQPIQSWLTIHKHLCNPSHDLYLTCELRPRGCGWRQEIGRLVSNNSMLSNAIKHIRYVKINIRSDNDRLMPLDNKNMKLCSLCHFWYVKKERLKTSEQRYLLPFMILLFGQYLPCTFQAKLWCALTFKPLGHGTQIN